jgi:hypothetical protein
MGKLEQLKQRVAEYLAENIYGGYSKPFELGTITPSSRTNGMSLFPKGITEEDIMEIDERWEKGLLEIGLEFGTSLRLDALLYAK